jgi:hypothetical protein
MKKEVAQLAINHVKASIKELEDSLVVVRDNCDEDESAAYRYGIGYALSEIHDRILDPIIREHPDLLPEGVDYVPPPGPMLAQWGAKYRDEENPERQLRRPEDR